MDNKLYYSGLKAAGNGLKLPKNGGDMASPAFVVRKADVNALGYTDQGPFISYGEARRMLEAIASLSGVGITKNGNGEEVVIFGDSIFSIVTKS